MSRRNRRKPVRKPAPKRRFRLPSIDLRRPLRIAGGLIALVVAGVGLAALVERPVRHLVVEAPFERVTAMQIEAAATPLLEPGFLSLDLDDIADAVEAIDWVDQVRVRRQWPSSVRLTVTEQVPAARWGETGLLNTRGELFLRDARHVPPELPRLAGPPGSERAVAKRYLDARAALLPMGLAPDALSLDARGAWQLELSTGVAVRLGRDDVDARMTRFLGVVAPLLVSGTGEANYVDMRYSNGFAVNWRPPADAAIGASGTKRGEDSDA